ncbi:putative major facilitator, sugar transporter, MFS transporter superfamily [Helianthus annuus]|nr:putative major facilitator, sugar transporter, MFS transporter superfamily [Helianthus annuus]
MQAKIGKQAEFDFALRKLRGTDVDVSEEAAEIKDYIETLDKLPKARIFDLFQTRYLKSVIIGVGLMIFQQFGGINGICFYASSIFASAGMYLE